MDHGEWGLGVIIAIDDDKNENLLISTATAC
jgi:hypothetical protein